MAKEIYLERFQNFYKPQQDQSEKNTLSIIMKVFKKKMKTEGLKVTKNLQFTFKRTTK